MKNIIFLTFLFFVSWNLAAMQEDNLIARLRNAPIGKNIMLYNEPWTIEENSLFLNNTGTAVLLQTTEVCGKIVREYRQTITIGFSVGSGKRNFTRTSTEKTTNWGKLMNGSLIAGLFALIGATVVFGKS